MVTFVQSYSYNRPFDGSHNVEVALSENEFDTPVVKYVAYELPWDREKIGYFDSSNILRTLFLFF